MQAALEFEIRYDALSALFSVSELRGMSRAAVVLRGMFRAERERWSLGQLHASGIGIYVLGEESSIAGFDMNQLWPLLESESALSAESFRKIPAKGFVALPMSRVGAQLAMESGAAGPLTCAHFEPASINFILDEIESDLSEGVTQGFILAAFLETRKDRAFLATGSSWSGEIRAGLRDSLERCLE